MRKAFVLFLFLGILVTVVYPAAVTGIGLLFFNCNARGNLMSYKGQVIGSSLISQNFSSLSYFWPRPSHAGTGHDGGSSGASNFSQTSAVYAELLKKRRDVYAAAHRHIPSDAIPPDALMASGSGLDPHISFTNALVQAVRVAQARGRFPEEISQILEQYKIYPLLSISYEPYVNILEVNIGLDEAFPE